MADPYELEKPSPDPPPQAPAATVTRSDTPPPLAPLPTDIPQMRFCPACGYNLTGLTDDHCPRCFRPFDPHDPSTTTDKPPRKLHERNYWLETPRLAGYAALLLALTGRLLINATDPTWAGGASDQGLSFGSIVSFFGSLLLIPWLAATLFLTLLAIDDRLGGRLLPILGAALLAGLILVLGYHPSLYIMAAVVAFITALVYRSFAT